MAAQPLPSVAPVRMAPRLGGAPEYVVAGQLPEGELLQVTATLLGTRINTRPILDDPQVAAANQGIAIVFRHGVLVHFTQVPGGPELEQAVRTHVLEPVALRETETAELRVASGKADVIGPGGEIRLADFAIERLLIVATILSRSVLLARDEVLVAQAFERTRPIVNELRIQGRVRLPVREVMRHVGDVLGARLRLTGTAQAQERPDLLWDFPALDRLYDRLDAEYELVERSEALETKFATLGAFSEALLYIAQDKRALRLEIIIVALIAFEIVLTLVEMAGRIAA